MSNHTGRHPLISTSSRDHFSRRTIWVMATLLLVAITISVHYGIDPVTHPILLLYIAIVVAATHSACLILSAILERVREDILYLAAETWCEAGPRPQDFIHSAVEFGKLFSFYESVYHNRPLVRLSTWLFPHHIPKNILNGATAKMAEAETSSDRAIHFINEAAKILAKLSEETQQRFGGNLYYIDSILSRQNTQATNYCNVALAASHKAYLAFADKKTPENAQDFCMATRIAGAATRFMWTEYYREKDKEHIFHIEQFRMDLLHGAQITEQLAASSQPSWILPLKEYTHSLNRRKKVVDSLILDRHQEYIRILQEELKSDPSYLRVACLT